MLHNRYIIYVQDLFLRMWIPTRIQWDKNHLPLSFLLFNILEPCLLFALAKNPNVLFLFNVLGWYVLPLDFHRLCPMKPNPNGVRDMVFSGELFKSMLVCGRNTDRAEMGDMEENILLDWNWYSLPNNDILCCDCDCLPYCWLNKSFLLLLYTLRLSASIGKMALKFLYDLRSRDSWFG